MAASLEARLLASIEPDTSQWGCWLWARGVQSQGYGALRWDGRMVQAHRAAFTLWVGPIPADKPHVCHHCDTRPCIRPDHLFAGTRAENMADMVRKGRQRQHAGIAANLPMIRARLAAGESQRRIAAAYGVSPAAIGHIATGRNRPRHEGLDAPDACA